MSNFKRVIVDDLVHRPAIELPINPALLSFRDDNGEVGSLQVVDGQLVFKGNADQSAKLLFDHVISKYSEVCVELAQIKNRIEVCCIGQSPCKDHKDTD